MTTERDLRIDSLRGLALCWITLAHLNFDTLQWAWDSPGHTSFAELFVFSSGLVAGIVYWAILQRGSAREVRERALARARVIYFSYLGLVVYIAVYIRLVHALGIRFAPWGCRPLIEEPAVAFALAPFFLYQPGFSNILPMYCVFMLLLPAVLVQIGRGRAPLVLAASVAAWFAAQQGAFRALTRPFIQRFDLPQIQFDLLAWQLLFVFGLYFGARRAAGRPALLPRSPALAWALAAPVLASFAIRHGIFFDASVQEAAKAVTQRHDLDLLRLLNFFALAYLVAFVSERHRAWFEWRWLAYLGQHSLQVFTFSVAAVYFARLFGRDADVPGQIITSVLALASLTLPAWVHVRYRAQRAERARSRG